MPIFTVIIGAFVLVTLFILKHTFNLTVVKSTRKEEPMNDKTTRNRAIFSEILVAIGSNVSVNWLLSARFYSSNNIRAN